MARLVPNSLGDLTKRENRFAHPASTFPFDARRWGLLGLPTLAECSSPTWMSNWVNWHHAAGHRVHRTESSLQIDMWDSANIAIAFGLPAGTSRPISIWHRQQPARRRLADDVILTNVIGFDVKVWEPACRSFRTNQSTKQPCYVKLGDPNYRLIPGHEHRKLRAYVTWDGRHPNYNHAAGMPPPFRHLRNSKSLMNTGYVRVYDSGCFSYENEGIYNFNNSGNPVPPLPSSYPPGLGQWPAGTSTNGLDDDSNGVCRRRERIDHLAAVPGSAPRHPDQDPLLRAR